MKKINPFVFMILAMSCFPDFAHASEAIGCSAKDKSLSFGFSGYEGGGLLTLFEDLHVEYKDNPLKKGLLNWFILKDSELSLTIYSWRGRLIQIKASRPKDAKDFGLFQIDEGFISNQDLEINLKGLILECVVG